MKGVGTTTTMDAALHQTVRVFCLRTQSPDPIPMTTLVIPSFIFLPVPPPPPHPPSTADSSARLLW